MAGDCQSIHRSLTFFRPHKVVQNALAVSMIAHVEPPRAGLITPSGPIPALRCMAGAETLR